MSEEALFACPSSNLLFFLMEFTFSSPCSSFDTLLFRQDAAITYLNYLPSHDPDKWLYSFLFGQDGYSLPANCSLCGTQATLSVSASRVFLNFFDQACAILRALCWSRQHQQVCHFSYFLFPQFLWQ